MLGVKSTCSWISEGGVDSPGKVASRDRNSGLDSVGRVRRRQRMGRDSWSSSGRRSERRGQAAKRRIEIEGVADLAVSNLYWDYVRLLKEKFGIVPGKREGVHRDGIPNQEGIFYHRGCHRVWKYYVFSWSLDSPRQDSVCGMQNHVHVLPVFHGLGNYLKASKEAQSPLISWSYLIWSHQARN